MMIEKEIYPEKGPEKPWLSEPIKKQWVDPETGLRCLILRGSVGTLCGYVAVEEEHPLFGMQDSGGTLHVHGGITFNDYAQGSIVFDGEDNSKFWVFGFDCAHAGDAWPTNPEMGGKYRTIEYVNEQVTSLARQIKDFTFVPISSDEEAMSLLCMTFNTWKEEMEKKMTILKKYGIEISWAKATAEEEGK